MAVQTRELGDYGNAAGSMAHSFPITLNDNVDLVQPTRVLFLACAGIVHYLMEGGEERTRWLPAGYHPLRIVRVYSTGTTIVATDMEGHY